MEQEANVAEILTPRSPQNSNSLHSTSTNSGIDTSTDYVFIDTLPEEAFLF